LPAAAGPVFVPDAPSSGGRQGKGFTLVEVLIAATLSSFVLAGVLSAFVFMGRTSFRSSGYSEMEAEVRRGLDVFAQDTRNATDVRWNSAQSVTLTVNGSPVTYAYDPTAGSPTYGSFYRLAGDAGSGAARTVLVRSVTPDFAFRRYKLEQPGVTDNTAQNDRETKLLQLTLRATRTSVATTGATQSAISARYLLRNKRVAN
jgi:prepilin-type N-terminal cleavage/methylation domain-containing protein